MINEINLNNNIAIEIDNLNNISRIKLDEFVESIKSIKSKYNLTDELKSAIKVLKRFKMTESAKW
jgi:hypothetical protein